MTSLLRSFAAVVLATLGFSLPASATTSGIDFTDLWFNPTESGWGINLIQQSDVIFATMFVYEGDRSPHWFFSDGMTGSGTAFSGPLYQGSGPAFNAPWTGGFIPSQVGTMSVTFTSPNTATLNYVVSGQSFSKQIQRQTWRVNNVSGNYIGGFTGSASACANPANNGLVLATGLFNASHAVTTAGGSVAIRVDFRTGAGVNASCAYNGTYAQNGRLGTLVGSYSCTLGTNGTFTISEIDASRNGFNGAYNARDNLGCNYNGFFGGVRDVI